MNFTETLINIISSMNEFGYKLEISCYKKLGIDYVRLTLHYGRQAIDRIYSADDLNSFQGDQVKYELNQMAAQLKERGIQGV